VKSSIEAPIPEINATLIAIMEAALEVSISAMEVKALTI
jgi:hypothetical protein